MKIPEILMIETVHQPGSLAKVLQVIGEAGLTIDHLQAHRGKDDLFELKLGGIKVKTTTTTVYAVGTADAVFEDKVTDTTAENYFLTGRYDRNISPKFFWFAGAGWDRNIPAGIQNRYVGFGGVGNN